MRIKKFVIGMVGTNCYIVFNEHTKECFAIDPAAPSAPMAEFIRAEGLEFQGILLTHGHFDHIMGIDALRQEWQIPVDASILEQEVLTCRCKSRYSIWGGYTFADADLLEDGACLTLAGYQIRVSTPGHTAGGCCYYRKRRCFVQRRYTVCRFCRENRLPDRQHEYTGTFCERAIAGTSGGYAGVSGAHGRNDNRI